MLAIAVGLLVLLAVQQLVFAVWHGLTPGWWRLPDGRPNWTGRQLMVWPLVTLAETLSLIALGTGNAPPLGTYTVVFGLTNVVMAGWLVLKWQARRRAGATGER